MGPSLKAMHDGKLSPLIPVIKGEVVYVRRRCSSSLTRLLGIIHLPILQRETRLARLVMIESYNEDHRSNPTDVLASSTFLHTEYCIESILLCLHGIGCNFLVAFLGVNLKTASVPSQDARSATRGLF